ncbi:MAG: hypothetical protein JST58_07180 [Bacteroidetes bacterium]|nr:hypothetical protein [Bacteroidota bacterium]
MRNACLSLILLFLGISLSAQQDSSRLDIGWLTLDRNLTQTLSVKGSDLEKMPFVNLSDAVRAWFYGAYTVPGTLAYVVDGNPVTDVNLYPIYDIEEVTLVMNAVGAAAYGSSQQDLVLVTTKRGKQKQGFRLVGQAGPVNANANGVKTFTNIYQQYLVSGYGHSEKFDYGLSADWVRDVYPSPSASVRHETTPLNLQRLRLNGYLRWEPVKGQILQLGIGYMPQQIDANVDSSDQINWRGRGHLLAPQLSWKGNLLPRLQEEFRAGIIRSSTDFSQLWNDGVNYGGILSKNQVSHFFAQERLGYKLEKGIWTFRPAVNLFYDHIDEKSAFATGTFDLLSPIPLILPPVLPPLQEQIGDQLFLTPSVELGWRQIINLQVGAASNLHAGSSDTAYAKLLPYASLGVDVFGFGASSHRKSSLVLSGSYAERAQMFIDDYSMMDLSSNGGSYSLADVSRQKYVNIFEAAVGGGRIDTIFSQQVPTHYPNRFKVYQAGIRFTLGKIFWANYSYERKEFLVPGTMLALVPYYGLPAEGSAVAPLFKSDRHHIDVRLRITVKKSLVWETGLGATALRSKYYYNYRALYSGTGPNFFNQFVNPNGDLNPAKLSWTGGFVNRLSMGSFEAGLDILYHFGETVYGLYSNHKQNSVMSPNIFAGYHWKLRHGQTLGFFIDSRGLFRSQTSDLPDNRRYYTVGGSLGL